MPWELLDEETVNTEIVAIHAALLPTSLEGDVLLFGDWKGLLEGELPPSRTTCRIFHPADTVMNPFAVEETPQTNAFCGGQAFLADGRLLVVGGTIPSGGIPQGEDIHGHGNMFGGGEHACWTYEPRQQTWTRVKNLNLDPANTENSGGRWYPSVITLHNGEAFAAGGHPDVRESYVAPNASSKRHNNNTPERYSATIDNWTLLTADITAPTDVVTDSYPRFHLLPTGFLFSATAGDGGPQRLFDPFSGQWSGPNVDASLLHGDYARGSSTTSVLLPLVPPLYRPRILACNSQNAFRIDVNDSPVWVPTSVRQGSVVGNVRFNACAVLLPTGQVFISGGVIPSGQEDVPSTPVKVPEIYTPGINWSTGEFSETENWQTPKISGSIEDAANVSRGYHSVALLLPDGRVWTAGSTESGIDDAEKQIEFFSPAYVGQSRPTIEKAPSAIPYTQKFQVTIGEGDEIERVALMRCGSVTHAFDSDQRYIGLVFTQQGSQLTVTAPPTSFAAPPGYYMLWIIDANGRPCGLAKFIRLCNQECEMILERSTFSRLEVEATLLDPDPQGLAVFEGAFFVFWDGFLPDELGLPGTEPTIKLTVGSASGPKVHSDISVKLRSTGFDDAPPPPDVAQRFTFLYDVRFKSLAPFDFTATDEEIFISASLAGFTCQGEIRLIKKPNPYMKDGNPEWLSQDLRVFKISPKGYLGQTQFAPGDTPETFLEKLLPAFDGLPDDAEHPFNQLPLTQQESVLELATTINLQPIYNFAVAKVRYKAIAEPASEVRVLFRIFNAAATSLEWTSSTTYRREVKGPAGRDTVGLLGMTGGVTGEIVSIPFFASPRVSPSQSMKGQSDDPNKRNLPGQGNKETTRYFGSWLDINQDDHHFPLYPQGDGPYSEDPLAGGPLYSVLGSMRNYHPCLIAEIYFEDDPIGFGDTPSTSDNLSQRNLVLENAANPGDPGSRRVATTMWVRPSQAPKDTGVSPLAVSAPAATAAGAKRWQYDELVVWWNNLPAGTSIELYIPSIDIDEILRLASHRAGATPLQKLDPHTIRSSNRNVSYFPLPGGLTKLLPCLLSVQLPEGVAAGQEFRVVIQQYSGHRKIVVGTVELRVPVRHREEMLPFELRKLAVLKFIQLGIPQTDRWFPVFERYLGTIANRVRGLGADPDAVEPTNHISTRPGAEPERPRAELERVEGKVMEVLYDCHGDFTGFVLVSCNGRREFSGCEPAIERLVREACASRATLTIDVLRGAPRRPLRVTWQCC
jgi:Galactose oxidase-like, Early set domain